MSKWPHSQALPSGADRFQVLCVDLAVAEEPSFLLAELNDLLMGFNGRDFRAAVAVAPEVKLPAFEAAYVAAMVECAAQRKRVPPPSWTRAVPALEQPWFASSLSSLRLHLLTASPPPFRRRNLFIDSGVGDRV